MDYYYNMLNEGFIISAFLLARFMVVVLNFSGLIGGTRCRQGHLKAKKIVGRWLITEDELKKFMNKWE